METVKLIGTPFSFFTYRVIWALKLKGITYEYINEDMSKKSPLLLKYNPIHKKVPVLIHGENSVCESMVIVEYIDETWPLNPLLSADPYDRSMARFWAKYVDDKSYNTWNVFCNTGEKQQNAIKESLEMLKTIGENALGEKKLFGGENIGLVDIAFGGYAQWMEIIEDIVGVKLLDPQIFPRINTWIKNFKKVPAIKENLPDRHEMFVYMKNARDKMLASP
ncbi:putative glutathione S-transferase [Nicotiana tabacum]|uniref:glutathione transferase n=1 Tax=Nicotiana tabacum TaxID=4097 RepID=A0A1S3Z743_TOBAC|nr:PREDICTED: probable glutathione S-transferase [Nicotiana tabacum]